MSLNPALPGPSTKAPSLRDAFHAMLMSISVPETQAIAAVTALEKHMAATVDQALNRAMAGRFSGGISPPNPEQHARRRSAMMATLAEGFALANVPDDKSRTVIEALDAFIDEATRQAVRDAINRRHGFDEIDSEPKQAADQLARRGTSRYTTPTPESLAAGKAWVEGMAKVRHRLRYDRENLIRELVDGPIDKTPDQ